MSKGKFSDLDEDCRRDLRSYLIGFVLSLVLSGVSFWVALGGEFSPRVTMCSIGALGLVQLFVQLRYFLHIDGKRENREDLYLVLFSSLVLLILVIGTIWILGNLNSRMMGPS